MAWLWVLVCCVAVFGLAGFSGLEDVGVAGPLRPAAAAQSLVCQPGYVLEGSSCIKTVAAKRTFTYSCPDGYVGDGATCTKTVTEEEPAQEVTTTSCPVGYSPSRVGCAKTVAAKRTFTYSCPAGYVGDGATCTKTTTVTTGAVASCPAGYSFTWTVCAKNIIRSRLKSYSCPAGKRLVTFLGTRVCVGRPNSAPTVTYSCPSGFTDVGSSCVRTLTRPATLVCRSGYVLSGATCSKTTTSTTRSTTKITYSCASGRLSGTSCVVTTAGITTTVYRCRSGWSLTGSTCSKTTTSTTRSTTKITYSCPEGRVSGTDCIITVSADTTPADTTPADTTPADTTPADTTPADTTTTTAPPRCPDGEHAHNPRFGSGVHPPGVLTTQAHRDAHGGGSAPTGCHGDHAPLERVQIDGYTGGSRTGPGTMTATFTVTPADASCRALLLGRTANRASTSPRTGSTRTVTVTAAAVGEIKVYVYCTHPRLRRSIERGVFVVTTPPPPCSSQDITIGPQSTQQTGQWTTTSCKSSQRGNDQTPYYAGLYTFTLDAAATVTVTAASSDHTPVVYVLSSNDEPQDPKEGERTKYELPSGTYTIEVTTTTSEAIGGFTLTVTTDGPGPATVSGLAERYDDAIVGKQFSVGFTYEPTTATLSVKTKPSGLPLHRAVRPRGGAGLAGRPTHAGTYTVTITLTQPSTLTQPGRTDEHVFTVVVACPTGQIRHPDRTCKPPAAPEITGLQPYYTTTVGGTLRIVFTVFPAAARPTVHLAKPILPQGTGGLPVTLNYSDDTESGGLATLRAMPTEPGLWETTLRFTQPGRTDHREFTVTAPPPNPPRCTTSLVYYAKALEPRLVGNTVSSTGHITQYPSRYCSTDLVWVAGQTKVCRRLLGCSWNTIKSTASDGRDPHWQATVSQECRSGMHRYRTLAGIDYRFVSGVARRIGIPTVRSSSDFDISDVEPEFKC